MRFLITGIAGRRLAGRLLTEGYVTLRDLLANCALRVSSEA
jgi:hypothetical protein